MKEPQVWINEALYLFQVQEENAIIQRDVERTQERYDMLMARHEREHQEDQNLVTMLKSDVERLAEERWALLCTHTTKYISYCQ